jgi:hypothetical protein
VHHEPLAHSIRPGKEEQRVWASRSAVAVVHHQLDVFKQMAVFCSLIDAQQLVESSVGIAYVCDLGCRWKLRFVSDASSEVTPALRKAEVTSELPQTLGACDAICSFAQNLVRRIVLFIQPPTIHRFGVLLACRRLFRRPFA